MDLVYNIYYTERYSKKEKQPSLWISPLVKSLSSLSGFADILELRKGWIIWVVCIDGK